ncbi:hypothetical protein KKJ09_12435 [Xenorhabdus bovienii]|uniref:hypothetical protein n=1 Tax=Xenorhabdus bovienii TaxID=40576 RepID=UPI0023B2D732|nr:hypothetical protein [Xenorhabdus bovienii]MDE9494369.1 hypothetical protein [Xenorhabdus bovienii]MDE9502808.1 hypothetical protein [Xenorhabdus bovienii]MDE9526423.1 hypothetical protein [Xenorhabdus bovienii]
MEKVILDLTYFKPTGKYYAESKLEVDKEIPWHKCIELVQFHFNGACLPGLVTGAKNYIVHVNNKDHPMTYPTIVTDSLKIRH